MCQIGYNEIKLLLWIQENLRSDFLDSFMKMITRLGDVGIIWIIIGVIFIISSKNRKMGFSVLLSLVFSAIICKLILKNYVARIRPYEVYSYIDLIIDKQVDYSFPSGHTSASIAASFAILKSNFSYKKFNLGYIFIGLAILISFSRLYLFMHYPTDVLGGLITGLISAELAIFTVGRISMRLKKKEVK